VNFTIQFRLKRKSRRVSVRVLKTLSRTYQLLKVFENFFKLILKSDDEGSVEQPIGFQIQKILLNLVKLDGCRTKVPKSLEIETFVPTYFETTLYVPVE
jgi:hypothetical protein